MANKSLMSGHKVGPFLGHKALYHSMSPLSATDISYHISYFWATKAPYRATKTHYWITRAPCGSKRAPYWATTPPARPLRASIGPQESGHKGPLAGYNGPILSHKSHYRVTRHLLVVHRPSVRTSNRATKTTCRPPRLSFGPLGFLIGTPGSLSG